MNANASRAPHTPETPSVVVARWDRAVSGARFVARMVNDKIETAGGGTLAPPIGAL